MVSRCLEVSICISMLLLSSSIRLFLISICWRKASRSFSLSWSISARLCWLEWAWTSATGWDTRGERRGEENGRDTHLDYAASVPICTFKTTVCINQAKRRNYKGTVYRRRQRTRLYPGHGGCQPCLGWAGGLPDRRSSSWASGSHNASLRWCWCTEQCGMTHLSGSSLPGAHGIR